jgi:hypothetical protein
MKPFSLTILFSILSFTLFSQHIDEKKAIIVANAKIAADGKTEQRHIISCKPDFSEKGNCLFYEIKLSPLGYIIISGNYELSPVIAFSYDNNIDNEGLFLKFVKQDIKKRLTYFSKIAATEVEKSHKKWDEYLYGNCFKKTTQQWPEAGTTTSGGWIETNWTQSAPYNNFCPIDPSNDDRSIAGCPSVAMAMIVDFHKTINQVDFTDADDYHHVYAGRNYWIDDDYLARGFPSWQMLNDYLDTLQEHYDHGLSPTNNDKAALVYACGVAAKQVYTSTGSGTFSVSQAYDAYLKFNFSQVQLLDTSDIADSSFYKIIIQNIKDTMPVHLAIVDSLWTMGHNIVVDGYNTDGFFHFNFGWGGSSNGWYSMLENMPYNMDFVEGAVVNIKPSSGLGINIEHNGSIKVFPSPANNYVNIEIPENIANGNNVSLWNNTGQKTIQLPFTSVNGNSFQINISSLNSGIYSGLINTEKSSYSFRIIKK